MDCGLICLTETGLRVCGVCRPITVCCNLQHSGLIIENRLCRLMGPHVSCLTLLPYEYILDEDVFSDPL